MFYIERLWPADLSTMCHGCLGMVGPSVLDCDKADLAAQAKKTLDAGVSAKPGTEEFCMLVLIIKS